MAVITRWQIRTQFVGDDGWTHEARVEGPPTPGYGFIEVVPASALEGAVEALEDAIAAVSGPVRHMPEPTYIPQVSARRVDRWRAALRAARGGK